jgi:pSer/pThr/pTyr-binding forkhead associated (FHA) protein
MQGMQINNDMYGSPPPQQQPPPNAFGGAPGGFAPQGPPPQQGFGAPPPAFGGPPPPAFGGVPPAAEPAPPVMQQPSPTAVRGFLISYQVNANGDFWPLKGGRMTVGRSNAGVELDIALADATISSRHAAVVTEPETGSVSVEDTGSTNGTYVNDEHLGQNGRRALKDGDRLRFGGFTTIVKVVGRV